MLQYLKKKISRNSSKYLLLIVLFLLLAACYFFGREYIYKHKKEVEITQFNYPKINFENFPYQYIDNDDKNVSLNSNYINIDLNEYPSDELLINTTGSYYISGNYSGKIIINDANGNIHLFLNNVNIKAIEGPAIIIKNALKVVITIVDGTNNTISDTNNYIKYNDYESCISSDETITINGSGSLTINGYYKDAIHSNDTVKIINGNISVKSKKTAIYAADGVNICGGKIFLASEKDAVKTKKIGNENKGSLIVSGGELDIIAGRYAFTSNAPVYIFNCKINDNSVATFNAKNVNIQEGCIK